MFQLTRNTPILLSKDAPDVLHVSDLIVQIHDHFCALLDSYSLSLRGNEYDVAPMIPVVRYAVSHNQPPLSAVLHIQQPTLPS